MMEHEKRTAVGRQSDSVRDEGARRVGTATKKLGSERSEGRSSVTLEDPRKIRSHAQTPDSTRFAWFIAPLLLAATATGILLVLRGPDRYFGLALGSMMCLAIAWILVSVLFPAQVERTCPICGRETLRRLDPEMTRGVMCSECGHLDRDASSFLMAEEEGSLESIVMAERKSSRSSARTAPRSETSTDARSETSTGSRSEANTAVPSAASTAPHSETRAAAERACSSPGEGSRE
jgi:hypothetical protein